MKCCKREKPETEEKQAEEPPPPKASLRELFRYSSSCDRFLLTIGSIVAIGTGCGLPLLSIFIGNMSQSFVDAQTLFYSGYRPQDTANITRFHNVSLPPKLANYTWNMFTEQVVAYCLQYVYTGIAVLCVAAIQVSCYLVACESMNHRIRCEFFKAVVRQNIAWFDENQAGSLTPKLFDNLERIKEGTGDKVALLIQFISQFFAGFIVAFVYDWRLTLIMMSLSPFMVICGAFLAKLMASATAKESENYAVAGGIAEEVITSIRTVDAFNGQQLECDRYNNALKGSMRTGILKAFYVGLGLAMTFLVLFSSYTLAFWVGTDYVYEDAITPGTMLTVFFGVMMGSMALGQAGPQFAVLGAAQGAAGTIFEIIDRVPEIDVYDQSGYKPIQIDGQIEFRNIEFSYPTRPDVKTVAVVGGSGCGKSTLVSLLLRYYNPSSGKILIDDNEISSLNVSYLRQSIGVVSQEPVLFNMTIKENIQMGSEEVTDAQMINACRCANAADFIDQLPKKYDTPVGDRGVQLSGGQKQRIAIARALVRNPKILLLDEATSALDAESESVVQEALEKAAKGRTTLVVAHRLSTIKNADKIIVIHDGRVVEMGTHYQLIAAKGYYHELVNSQVFVDIEDNAPSKIPLSRRQSTASYRSRSFSVMTAKSGQETSKVMLRKASRAATQIGETELNAKKETERLKKEMMEEGGTESGLLEILKYSRPEWIYILIGLLVGVIQGCVFPAFSLFFSEILAIFAKPKDSMLHEGHFWSLMFLVLGGIEGITLLVQTFFFGLTAERLTRRLRSRLFRNILRMDMTYFDSPNHSSGKLCTRLATDTPNVKSAIDYRLSGVLVSIVSIGCGIGIAAYYSWQMALLLIAIFPLEGVGKAVHLKYIEGHHKQDAKEMANAGKVALETIENIRTVQALTLEQRMYAKFCGYLQQPIKNATKRAIVQGLSYGFANSIFFFLYSASYRFGAFLIMAKLASPIDVLRVLFAISFTAGSAGYASAYFPEYAKAKFAAGIIFKMLGEKPKIDCMGKDGTKMEITGSVDFTKLHFAYPQRADVEVLKGLSLHVDAGKTLAIVGPSGCGKSTVVSLLERFYEIIDGSIAVDGTDIRSLNVSYLRSQMALVSQEPILFDCSIRENIIYGLREDQFDENDIRDAAELANIDKFISDLPEGYETRVGEKGVQLSGGQKQRIAIARALLRKPKILLLDEATSALDAESEKVVQEALDRAGKGRTCIVIAHRLSTVVNADCIAVLQNGIILEKGTHAELMSQQGAYYKLTNKQNLKEANEKHDQLEELHM
uniref:Multidrug resistance protein pgp-1 n=1 Tax=Anisakis simplex TaxID=6269 RepID=A0A346RVL4_ANISI|nr:multidrug resistance protein pgp-1 [Anisakis simplex]